MAHLPTDLPHRRLQDALDALDATFAPLAKSSAPVGGCTHCYTEAELEVLAGPVGEVPDELMYSVAHQGPDHWDDFPGLYRRLTPRTVRLLVADGLDHGLVASRLLAARWRDWPVAERRALEEVWHTWWRAVLHSRPSVGHVTDVLETLSASTGTLAPWLAVWAGTRTEAADLHLGDALDRWLVEDGLAELSLGFYGEVHATPELLPWLLSLEDGRIGAAQLTEVERISFG
ncbi:hypothetical protein RM704_20160 [Streptomyces sp. DSM 3412]|uniref:Uncharacterized protein n=1 Tax=Streptomyces gottesmaniae TaxID=3075518 RepID=A0ABU2Z2Y0_9ACTN|nr:hypothetical protein [Streptomyces sp. DSM 3412]MDT0569762.1 hypothetical protein [Streptomyces sp. DSM 3412]